MMGGHSVSSALVFVLLDVAFIGLYVAFAGYAWIARLIRRLRAR